ncbi:MAG: pknB, partial [Marmoricola sp.]|nr:pknB [Marmoricola sp.]
VADGAKVTLFWSDGPEDVPSVVGKTEAAATKLIEGAGFKVSRVTDSSTKSKKGTVLQQSPATGQTLDKGSTVTIVVSTYEAPKPPAGPSGSLGPSSLPSP